MYTFSLWSNILFIFFPLPGVLTSSTPICIWARQLEDWPNCVIMLCCWVTQILSLITASVFCCFFSTFHTFTFYTVTPTLCCPQICLLGIQPSTCLYSDCMCAVLSTQTGFWSHLTIAHLVVLVGKKVWVCDHMFVCLDVHVWALWRLTTETDSDRFCCC